MTFDRKYSFKYHVLPAFLLLVFWCLPGSAPTKADALFSDKASCEEHVLAAGSVAVKAPLEPTVQTEILSQLDRLVEKCSEGKFDEIAEALAVLSAKINAASK